MIYEQTEPANIWLIEHALNSISPVVTTWLSSSGAAQMVIPREISIVDEDNIRVIFTSPQTGGAAVTTTSLFSYTHTQALSSNYWTVQHNLGAKFVNLDVIVLIDGKYQTIWPKTVTAPDENTVIITFSTPMTGFVRVGA